MLLTVSLMCAVALLPVAIKLYDRDFFCVLRFIFSDSGSFFCCNMPKYLPSGINQVFKIVN